MEETLSCCPNRIVCSNTCLNSPSITLRNNKCLNKPPTIMRHNSLNNPSTIMRNNNSFNNPCTTLRINIRRYLKQPASFRTRRYRNLSSIRALRFKTSIPKGNGPQKERVRTIIAIIQTSLTISTSSMAIRVTSQETTCLGWKRNTLNARSLKTPTEIGQARCLTMMTRSEPGSLAP